MTDRPTSQPHLSRRTLLKTGAGFAAAAFMPAASFARVLGANERLHLGIIGTGGMGTAHLNGLLRRQDQDAVRVTRVCDVYRRRLNNAVRMIGGAEESGTMEYREIIDDRSVDAVIIATPDHWHTAQAIEAMENGKDVYCEKPLSLTIEQAIECRDAVHRTGRTLQVGPQGTSDGRYWTAREAIDKGRIGKVVWSQASYCRNSREGQFNWRIDPDAGPNQARDSEGYVWWDRWLGHERGLAEKIDWNADHFFRFRKYFAYNGGVATDLLYHKLAPLLIAISGPDGEYPSRVTAAGGQYVEKDGRDIPDTFMMMIDYPSEHTIVLSSVMLNDHGLPDVIRGQYGTMEFDGNFDRGERGRAIRLLEQSAWSDRFREANSADVRFPSGDGGNDERPGRAFAQLEAAPRRDHMGNFFDAIRENAPLACNIDLGASTMVAIKLGVEAYRQNKVMQWKA